MSLKCDLSRLSLDMEGEKGKINQRYCSKLLELSAVDDVTRFIAEVEENGCDVNESSFWYGRRFGSKKMGFGEITPLLIAAMYGNLEVLKYILGTGKVDVNRAYGLDGVTALHCAAAGGSSSVIEVFKLLIDAGGDINSVDANGNKPLDLAVPNVKSVSNSRQKVLEMLLNGVNGVEEQEIAKVQSGSEKKEYPIDVSLPDINTGLYGSDDFRMYSFKVMPCSRAYSHDWTECPFVHPGENARRRDPRKYHYSCVPCPEFKKGTCAKGDHCEYAHGVFESWLHPAQYRTRLCKDETGCNRKVCFFAHKPEDLRPLYATTGSAMPSPKSLSVGSMDMSCLSPSTLGSSSLFMSTNSTAPMSPSAVCSSPMATNMWQNKVNLTPPALQLHGSRLKTTRSARDLELEMELLGLENIRTRQQLRQHLIEEMAGLSSPMGTADYDRMGYMNPTNLDDVYGSIDPSLMSPTAFQMRQNTNPIRASYPSNISSSPGRKTSGFGFETSAAVAAAVMNSRSSAFAKRSQSFNYHANAAASSPKSMSSTIPDWGSPTGKLDWGFKSEDPNKFRKSASFALRNANVPVDEPDVSWVNSLVKDVPSSGIGSEQKHGAGGGIHEMMPSWIDQLYIDQEQMVA